MSLKVGELFGSLNLDDGPFNRTLRAAGLGLGNMTKLAGAAAVAGGAAIVASAGVAAFAITKIGMGYQDSLNVFRSVSGANAEQMQRVADMAKQLGNDLTLPGISAADAATAMTQLAKAGLTVEQSMAAAQGVLQLAKAAEVDVGTAADMTASALNAFGLSGDQAVRVADLLAAAANSSMGEITDMGNAMSQSSAIFASAGISVEDLTASIAMLANKGILGSDAGTSLKTMLMSLQAPTGAAKDALDGLGVSVYNADGSMRGYRDIIDSMSTALAPLTDAQKAQAIETIFGSDAARAANIIFGQGVEAFDASREAVTKQGAAAEVAAAKSAGLSGAIENVKSTLETMAIGVYEEFSPAIEEMIRGFTESLSEAATWSTEMYDKFKNAFSGMETSNFADAFRAAFGDDSYITSITEKLAAFKNKIIEIWNNPAVKAAIETFVMNIWQAGTQLGPIFDNLKQIFSSLLPYLQILATIVGGAFLTGLNALGIAANIAAMAFRAVTEVWQVLAGVVGIIAQGVIAFVETIIALVQNLGILKTVAQETWDLIKNVALLCWQDINAVWGTLVAVFSAIWEAVKSNTAAAWEYLKALAIGAWEAITSLWNGIMGFFSGVWESVRATTQAVWDSIQAFISGIYDAIVNRTGEAVGSVLSFFSELPGKIVTAVQAFGGSFINLGSWVIDKLIEGLKSIGDKMGSVAGEIKDAITSAVESAFGISSPATAMIPLGVNIAKGLIKGMLGVDAKEFATSVFGSIWKVGKAIPSVMGSIASQFGWGGGGGVSQWLETAMEALQIAGAPMEWLPLLMAQIQSESGGDPNAQNNWDSNAMRGDPTGGLLQNIPSAFQSRLVGTGLEGRSIFDPLASLVAGIRYMMWTYGSPVGVWGEGHGYAEGGISLSPALAEVSAGGPELHLTRDNVREFLGLDGKGGVSNVSIYIPESMSHLRDTIQVEVNGMSQSAIVRSYSGVRG